MAGGVLGFGFVVGFQAAMVCTDHMFAPAYLPACPPIPGFAYICNVAVAPSAQRSGVATRLMAEAEAIAATWGCSKAALHVNMTNTPAVGLYR